MITSVARMKTGKCRQREKINSTRVDRTYKLGDLVLVKVPGRSGAFQCSWEGPFPVEAVLSRVNYQVRGKTAHVNNRKTYRERQVARVAIAEQENECEKKGLFEGEPCRGYNSQQLEELLRKHEDTFSASPGLCRNRECVIHIRDDALLSVCRSVESLSG